MLNLPNEPREVPAIVVRRSRAVHRAVRFVDAYRRAVALRAHRRTHWTVAVPIVHGMGPVHRRNRLWWRHICRGVGRKGHVSAAVAYRPVARR